MKRTRQMAKLAGSILCAVLFGTLGGCVTYLGPAGTGPGYGNVALADDSYSSVEEDSDFYEPLSPYGQWEVIGSYGRCWIPGRIEADWRPYCDGQWISTDAGWYWDSTEPWAWATYHYGCWDYDVRAGWFWIPDTRWAPAWVSWHEGNGYIGWAALGPGARRGGFTRASSAPVSPRGYVFVDQRQFLDRVRPTSVVHNSTTLINSTTNITNIKVVNRTVINEGPPTADIERASGRRVQSVAAGSVRREKESVVFAGKPPRRPVNGRNAAPSAQGKNVNSSSSPQPAPHPRPVQTPIREPAAPAVAPPPPPAAVSHREESRREVPPVAGQPAKGLEEEPRTHSPAPPPVAGEPHPIAPPPAPVQEPTIHHGPVKSVPPKVVAPKEDKGAGHSGKENQPGEDKKRKEGDEH